MPIQLWSGEMPNGNRSDTMTTEITAPPFAVTWSTAPDNPRRTRYKRNRLRARWQDWREFATAEDAADAARANGLAQFIPANLRAGGD